MEKKFDKLLNEKCTWSYKTQRVRSNKITNEDDSTVRMESTVMTIEISENTLDKELHNKQPEKNLNSMENKRWLKDEQVKTNGTKNYKKKTTRNVRNKVYSPLKKKFNDNRGKRLPKKTMLAYSKRLPSQKLLLNSDKVLQKSSLKHKDEITVLSSSSDEEVLQARNPAHDKVIYEDNDDNSDSCNMTDKEVVSDEEVLESRDITKKTSPIIIQATPYINQNDADSINQNCEGKQSSESNKGLKNQLEKDKFLFHISKQTESTSVDSLSVEPNTPSSERDTSKEIVKTKNYGETNTAKDKSFDNGNKKHSLKCLPENIADDDSITQDLEESETPPDKNIISDFLSGSLDVSTYKVKERYFDYDPMENSRETNLNSQVLEKNYQFESETASPELFTNDIYETNIFKERELNHSSIKNTKYKQSELVTSTESQVFPTQKRKLIKKRQTKNVNKKRKIQCSQDDSESEDALLRKTNMKIGKVKHAPKETFIECINLDSTGDEGTIYRHVRSSSLLASQRIKEIGKVESISVINDSDIYSVHDESSLSDNFKKNIDEIMKKYLKNDNMQNKSNDVIECNRKTKKNSSFDKDKRNGRNKRKFQVNKKFEEDSNEYLLRKNRNKNSRNKEPTSNLYLSNDQHSSKDQKYVPRSKNKYPNNTKLKTCNGKQMRKNTDKNSKIEEFLHSNISDEEENYLPQRQKCSARNKIKSQEYKAKADNDHLLRENKNKKSNINVSDDGSARNQKYLTRSKYQKFKADNDDYHLEKNEDHKGFYKNLHLESGKNRGKLENKKKEMSKINIENESMKNIVILNNDILPKYTKDTKSKNITKGKQKTWDDLENELLKDLDDEITFNDERNVSKTIIVRQEKLVTKKDISNNTKLLTVSNKSMTQRISKSLKGGSYMQYEVQNTQNEYLESTATNTNRTGKEIISANSENISAVQKAIAAMDKCTAEFMKHKEVNILENRWMENNFMIKENSSLSNDTKYVNNDVLLEEHEPCTSNKMVPYMKNLRSSNKCINKNKTPKVSNYHDISKKDDGNSDAEHSVNISYKNSAVNNAKKNKQNAENGSLVLYQEDNPWEGLIKKLDSEQTSKNSPNTLYKEAKCERKELCKMFLNSCNKSSNGSQADNTSHIDNIEKEIDNELTDLESLNHSTPEDDTSLKEDILNNEINLLTNTEKFENDSNNRLAHDVESRMSKIAIKKVKSNRNDGKNILTPSKPKTLLFKGNKSPILKFQVKKDGSLKLKKNSSKSLSETSSSEYSIKLKAAPKDIRIKQNTSNKTNKSREKYTNYLKKLYKMDSVVERDQTVAPNVETIEQFTAVTSEENRYLIADDTKNQLQKSKLIAEKDDDVFSVSSSESDDSKKGTSCGSGILCEFFDK